MKLVKKVWNAVTTVLVVAVVMLALLLAGPRLFGLQVFSVLSGSMEPELHTGALIYVKAVDYREIEKNDVITFMLSEDTVATHRVMGVVPDENDPTVLRYRTKGDANENEDSQLVHYKNIIGQPIFSIPYLGYLSTYVQDPPGTYLAISFGAILLLLLFLPDLLFDDKDESSKKKNSKKNEAADNIPEEAEPKTIDTTNGDAEDMNPDEIKVSNADSL